MYTEAIPNLVIRSGVAPAVVSAAATIDRHLVMDGVWAQRFMFTVTTAVVSGTPVVLALRVRTAYGVTANQVTIATLTIPGGTAAGAIYYKDFDPKKILPGQELVADVTAAGTSGAGIVGVKLSHQSETPFAVTPMVASI